MPLLYIHKRMHVVKLGSLVRLDRTSKPVFTRGRVVVCVGRFCVSTSAQFAIAGHLFRCNLHLLTYAGQIFRVVHISIINILENQLGRLW